MFLQISEQKIEKFLSKLGLKGCFLDDKATIEISFLQSIHTF